MSEVARYLATLSPAAITACGLGIFSLIRLRMRLKFHRYIVDKAAAQGQPIDATKIIEITTPKAAPRRDATRTDGAAPTRAADDGPLPLKGQSDSDCSARTEPIS